MDTHSNYREQLKQLTDSIYLLITGVVDNIYFSAFQPVEINCFNSTSTKGFSLLSEPEQQ